jgi:glycosyltransferase involved in cell wall biosynthesis
MQADSPVGRHPGSASGDGREEGRRPMRLAVIVNTIVPYTRPLFERLAQRDECELLVVSETTMERDRHWDPETDLPFEHVLLESWTIDLAWLARGSGFRTRFDTYFYAPKHPLRPLAAFAPDVVVAGGGGIWSSPANIAALTARRRRGWAVLPWWGSFTRPHPTWPRRLADPWVKYFMRSCDACLAHGTRHVRDLAAMGVDPNRTVLAPITALAPERPPRRESTRTGRQTRFLFVGRLIERKGLDVLLRAFARFDGGELWIAGDGPIEGAVAEVAARDPRIRLFGHVAGADLDELYRQVDVLVVPSLYEPWGLVVHEGLAHGLPVITTDQTGAAYDLIDSGVNGYVVTAGSAEETFEAMRSVAEWTPERRAAGVDRSLEKLTSVTLDRGADGFVRGSQIALEHRRRTAKSGSRTG